MIRELNGSDQVVKEYMRGLGLGGGIGSIIYQKKSSDYYYYHYNHKGDVMALTDANGKLSALYEYDAWGNTMTEAEKTGVENPYRYSTKEWDEKSGLSYFGFRYYSPEIGRWTQRDPAGTVDGLNAYTYARNDPGGNVDPAGELTILIRRRPTLELKPYWWRNKWGGAARSFVMAPVQCKCVEDRGCYRAECVMHVSTHFWVHQAGRGSGFPDPGGWSIEMGNWLEFQRVGIPALKKEALDLEAKRVKDEATCLRLIDIYMNIFRDVKLIAEIDVQNSERDRRGIQYPYPYYTDIRDSAFQVMR